jgi:hypothetical protein
MNLLLGPTASEVHFVLEQVWRVGEAQGRVPTRTFRASSALSEPGCSTIQYIDR